MTPKYNLTNEYKAFNFIPHDETSVSASFNDLKVRFFMK